MSENWLLPLCKSHHGSFSDAVSTKDEVETYKIFCYEQGKRGKQTPLYSQGITDCVGR